MSDEWSIEDWAWEPKPGDRVMYRHNEDLVGGVERLDENGLAQVEWDINDASIMNPELWTDWWDPHALVKIDD
jgi:hypothetical protein